MTEAEQDWHTTPEGLYQEAWQFAMAMNDHERFSGAPKDFESIGKEGQEAFTITSEKMNRLAQEATLFDHWIAFDMSEEGSQQLANLLKNVPISWHADFYELFEYAPTRTMIQYFRTERPINPFLMGTLMDSLPMKGAAAFQINKPVINDRL